MFEFTLALATFCFIALLKNVFKFTDYPYISEWLKIGLFIAELSVVSWYLFKALNNPNLFRNIDSKLKLVADVILEEKEIQPVNEIVPNPRIIKLKKYMVEEKPYLNPNLTIQDVATAIEIPTRELSILINHTLEQHFYDFINAYRIQDAMIILKDATKNKVTILEILYEVGFNSKSSFNTAFKNLTGFTPTTYRNSLNNNTL